MMNQMLDRSFNERVKELFSVSETKRIWEEILKNENLQKINHLVAERQLEIRSKDKIPQLIRTYNEILQEAFAEDVIKDEESLANERLHEELQQFLEGLNFLTPIDIYQIVEDYFR